MAFVDRVVEFPGRKTLTGTDGTVLGTYDTARAEGTVTEEGTPLNAENLNAQVEAMISAAVTASEGKTQRGSVRFKITKKSTASKTVTFPAAFPSVPYVQVTPVTTVPASRTVGVSAVKTTGFTLYGYSTTDVNLIVYWEAGI